MKAISAGVEPHVLVQFRKAVFKDESHQLGVQPVGDTQAPKQ